ncbi:MT-a70 family protein [Niveomyces insectorum RCEF 264]|uniref:MT-a70 family protein n=1 Tax=Niveomyces insectorum RCEF 264 TaxID=1081102 RepID=A0A167NB14_9HYPO|nr:MT-a70 family protein [Niveomyces insectorum RCEF 264]
MLQTTSSPSPSPSSILFENESRTVVVIDVPRSIEEAQEPLRRDSDADVVPRRLTAPRRHLLSAAPPPTEAYPPPPVPRSEDATLQLSSTDPAAQLAELTTQAAVGAALHELHDSGFPAPAVRHEASRPEKEADANDVYYIPTGARYLAGTIDACRDEFLAEAPCFDLIVMDPPWPNRSAQRRRRRRGRKLRELSEQRGQTVNGTDSGYSTAGDMASMRDLLSQIPVGAKLADGGLVAVWVTNKPACVALVTDPRDGLFRAWGVDWVATWTWLKVTAGTPGPCTGTDTSPETTTAEVVTGGVPVVPLDAAWRKPWERVLLGRRRPASTSVTTVPRLPLPSHRVIVGVPDGHSRKPHLRPLLVPFLSSHPNGEEAVGRPLVGLEVFARSLTAGWWAWGDEVLLFHHASWWASNEVVDDAADQEAPAGAASSTP